MDGLDIFNEFLEQTGHKSRYLSLISNPKMVLDYTYISVPYFISHTFIWDCSTEGYNFWLDISKHWRQVSKQYKQEWYTLDEIIHRLSEYSYNDEELWTD